MPNTNTTAAVLRQIYLKQGIGVGALRRIYGGSQRRGVRRKTTVKGAGGCIRHVLIQFEVRWLWLRRWGRVGSVGVGWCVCVGCGGIVVGLSVSYGRIVEPRRHDFMRSDTVRMRLNALNQSIDRPLTLPYNPIPKPHRG